MDKKYTELLKASRYNDVASIKKEMFEVGLIKRSPNAPVENDHTALLRFSYDTIMELNQIMSELLLDAISHGDQELSAYLIESADLVYKASLNNKNVWISAINSEDLDMVKYLAQKTEISQLKNLCFALLSTDICCKNKEIWEYLLDDPSMPHHVALNALFIFAEENANGKFMLFINFCNTANQVGIETLINSKDYRDLITYTSFHKGLTSLCFSGQDNAEMVKYLLINEDIPFKPYSDLDPNRLLVNASFSRSMNILNYLVFDFKVPEPVDYAILFTDERDNSIPLNESAMNAISLLKNLFKTRELQDNLEIKTIENKNKVKI